MKKVISIIIILALCLALVPVSLADNGPITFSADAVSGAVGDTVSVLINMNSSLKAGETMYAINFEVRYDNTAVKLVGYTEDGDSIRSDFFKGEFDSGYISNIVHEDGRFYFAWANTLGTNANGVLLGLDFKILSNDGSALTMNNISYSTLANPTDRGTSYAPDVIHLGGISVGSGSVPTPDPSNNANDDDDLIISSAPQTTAPVIKSPTASLPATLKTPEPSNAVETTQQPSQEPQSSAEPQEQSTEVPRIQLEIVATDEPKQTDVAPQPDSDTAAEPTQDPATDPNAADTNQDSGSDLWIFILGGVGAALIVGALVVFIIQKKKQREEY